jgi:hypothetical protein
MGELEKRAHQEAEEFKTIYHTKAEGRLVELKAEQERLQQEIEREQERTRQLEHLSGDLNAVEDLLAHLPTPEALEANAAAAQQELVAAAMATRWWSSVDGFELSRRHGILDNIASNRALAQIVPAVRAECEKRKAELKASIDELRKGSTTKKVSKPSP